MRIGINVPDDLLKRFEPIKQVTNVSQVCRDAIKTWVDTYEAAKQRARQEGIEEIADRLSEQVAAQTVDWEALGLEDAKMWCQLATLKDFQREFHNLASAVRNGERSYVWSSWWLPGNKTKTFWHRRNDQKEWFEQLYEFDEGGAWNRIAQAEQEYGRSFLAYVTAVWQMVQDRVGAAARAREAALKQTQAKVEVPDHLLPPGPTANV